MLDEVPLESRGKYREVLDHRLNAPVDQLELEQYESERWGLSSEAVAESEQGELLFDEWERMSVGGGEMS